MTGTILPLNHAPHFGNSRFGVCGLPIVNCSQDGLLNAIPLGLIGRFTITHVLSIIDRLIVGADDQPSAVLQYAYRIASKLRVAIHRPSPPFGGNLP